MKNFLSSSKFVTQIPVISEISKITFNFESLKFLKPSCFQRPSPSHQLPPYLLSPTSKNILFGLPLFLFPGNSISIIFLPTYSWSLLMTCPYHLSLPSLIFIPNRSTLTVLPIYSFLILSFLVTPIANLNILISAASISSTYFFVAATVSSPYSISGLITKLYTFPFTQAGNLLSQITPDTFLHSFHPACTLFFTSLSQLPLSYTVDPKYLNSFTLGTFVSSIFTVSLSFFPFMHRYSVFDLLTFISLLFNTYFQDYSLRSTFSLVSSQNHNIIIKQHRP